MLRWIAPLLLVVPQATQAGDEANWPSWRGDGSGISRERNPPLYWSLNAGVAWKTELPGSGNSSPVVWGERVFLTAATDAGTNRHVICLDRNNGKFLWKRDLPATRTPETHVKNGYASATAATDGERVYAFFDSPGLVALDLDGKPLWTRDLGPFKNSYNVASSPILCGDLVIECCDQETGAFIVAFDKRTGAERWRTPRTNTSMQFSTPVPVAVDGKTQLVVNGNTVLAYDPADGKAIWSCRGMRPNVTPSAVAHGDVVYAASGRNGPAMAIDPRGTGDVTETHVRMQISSGGPYIPSPLAFPDGLLLPGDDGRLRLIGREGKILCELGVQGHFTASPVSANNVIYWPNEKGQVAVIRLAGEANAPRLEHVAVNHVGSACLASIAIAGRKLFVRTDKALLCITGTTRPDAPTAVAELPGTLTELRTLYAQHPATDGADAAMRIAVVERLGTMTNEESIALLTHAALKDPQWDVGEAAAKSLATIGRPAIPALIALMGAVDWQPYLKTIAADTLGQLAATEAVPALQKASRDNNMLVREPSVSALGKIAAADPKLGAGILPTLQAGLADREGAVRKAAAVALARYAVVATDVEREAIVVKLTTVAADKNPLVAQAAADALKTLPQPPAATTQTHAPPPAPSAVSDTRWLNAGPIRLKFTDGELRYLYVAGKEVVRRLYFAVRDGRYDTVMPAFRTVEVITTNDAFTIKLAAACSNDTVGFSWTATIAGTADGTITFQVDGQVDRDFQSPRVGLNVLFGTESLAGQAYELVGENGSVTNGSFPRLVTPASLSDGFRTLRYAPADGLRVSVGLAEGRFGMEDQRNFCDSSYKAYSGMAFKYMGLKKGEKGSQTLTLAVKSVKPGERAAAAAPLRLKLGQPVAGATLPKLATSPTSARNKTFLEIMEQAGKHSEADAVVWTFNVAVHLPDTDTFMENIPAIVDQAKAVRASAPRAKLRVEPATFSSPYPRPAPDTRLAGAVGAAWAVRMTKHLALAGVEEAVLGAGGTVVSELAKLAGARLLAITIEGTASPAAVDALAVEADGRRQVWVVNLTDEPAFLLLAGLGAEVTLERGWSSTPEAPRQEHVSASGDVRLKLAPFETCRVTIAK